MSKKDELISLIVPVYNRADLLTKTIESVLNQDHVTWELIIVDDGSTDNSLEICLNYARENERIKVYKRNRSPKGASVCRNIGIECAQGDYLMFLDSDDLLSVDCLERRLTLIRSGQNLDFIVTQTGLFNSPLEGVNRLWSSLIHENDIEAFVRFEGWCISSSFFRTSFIKKYSFDEKASCLQDWGFHVKILLDSPCYQKFPESHPDVFIRSGHQNRISQTNTNTERISSRFKVLLGFEKGIGTFLGANASFLRQYFQHLEFASVELSNAEFNQLFRLWKRSTSYQEEINRGVIRFLRIQNIFKRFKMRFMNAILYKLSRRFFSQELVGPSQRAITLRNKIIIHE